MNKPRKNMKSRWSLKYKRKINCSSPKGFSQKNYCKRQKRGGRYLEGFREWLVSESKGIRLSDDITNQILANIDKMLEAAKIAKQTPDKEIFDVAVIRYKDPYFKDKSREVPIHVINSSWQEFHGDFRPLHGIEINVAHVEDKDITPRWIERILAHELIHSSDPKISDFDTYSKMGAKNYARGGIPYYLQPLEFDAYTGQFVYSIINSAKRYKGTDKESIISKYLDDALKYMRNPEKAKEEQTYGFIADPEYWKYYQIYYLHGSTDQKRKLQQRIYKAIMDAKEILK